MAKIFVIDDHADIRDALNDLLVEKGHEVTCFSDGRDAVDAHCANPADVIITDILMPDYDGIELICELKGSAPKVKIIAITGGGRTVPTRLLSMAEGLGADATFGKPFDCDELLEKIEELTQSA